MEGETQWPGLCPSHTLRPPAPQPSSNSSYQPSLNPKALRPCVCVSPGDNPPSLNLKPRRPCACQLCVSPGLRYAEIFGRDAIYGGTKESERERLLATFRISNRINTIFLSRVRDSPRVLS